ncbi:MAG: hypothetical protein M0R28_20460 [Pigmentiphaga sp.]|nr:hypothetical protein [Pigmentiphaga sp.]
MSYLNDRVLDLGLNVLTTEANALHICSAEPSTYAQATDTLSLGVITTPTVPVPAAGTPDGRAVTIAPIATSTGEVTATGTATHYALVDTTGERLLAVVAATSPQAVTEGNTWGTTGAITIRIPAVA